MEVSYNVQTGYRRSLYPSDEEYILKAVRADASLSSDGIIRFLVVTGTGRCAAVEIRFLSDKIFSFLLYQTDSNGLRKEPVRKQKQVFDFAPKRKEAKIQVSFLENADYWLVETEEITLTFRKEYWEMSIFKGDQRITKEEITDTNVDNRWKMLPLGFSFQDGRPVSARENLSLGSDEMIWGLGEKYTEQNRRGRVFHIRQMDALSTDSEKSYQGHPFYISSRGYGLFANSFSESTFDVGASSQLSLQIRIEDADLDLVFLVEGEGRYKELVQDYVGLTGSIPLIPKWAFGFWQSKCSYNSQKEVEDIARKAQELNFPIDVIHIDNWQGKEQAGTFRWNRQAFPDPKGMIKRLHEQNIHLSVWNYPYVGRDCPEFPELEKKEFFVKNSKGHVALFRATADSDTDCACFDFTNPKLVSWYKERICSVLEYGVDVIKTDFSEALPEDAVLYDGSTGMEAHNKIPYLYTNLVYDTMKEFFTGTDRIPLIWSRSGYLGGHRVPAVWAGDSSSESTGLSAILHGGTGLSACGVAYWGYDLGGFFCTGPSGDERLPSEEQYIRSAVMGCFMPLARAHGKTSREPWNISDRALKTVGKMNHLRHRLLPYLWHTALQAVQESIPMLRPMYMEYPMDIAARKEELEYFLGDCLLVAPPFERESYTVYLPKGKWMNFFTGEIVEGGSYVNVRVQADEIPVYIRNGSVIEEISEEEYAGGRKDNTNHYERLAGKNLLVFTDHQMEKKLYDAEYNSVSGYCVTEKYIQVIQDQDGKLVIPENIRQNYESVNLVEMDAGEE